MRHFSSVFAAFAAALGAAFTGGAASAQGQVAPQSAPRPWLAFADAVNLKLIDWLRADDDAAVRLRAYVEGLRTDPAISSPPIILSIWTDAAGIIITVEFAPFVHQQPNTDLRGILIGKAVGTPPPRDILFPLRLAVQLDPAPEAAVEGADPAQAAGR